VENATVLKRTDLKNILEVAGVYNRRISVHETTGVNPVHDTLVLEGAGTFLEYLKWLDLADDPNLLVLSSRHHFFYDQNDLKGVNVLVNIKRLNHIRHLGSFLHILFRVLPSGANFIGCFSDSGNIKRNGKVFFRSSIFYKKFIDFLDYRTDRNMSKSEVTELLDTHGFIVINMKEIKGVTYFNALNKRKSGE
jgi:hypothetical protein